MILKQASFYKSAAKLQQCPINSLGEIAFAGRSNSGKSSVINTLTHQVGLAKVSKTPGRTQLINFFTLAEDYYLVDLPGYGYAKVPEEIRKNWEKHLAEYLMKRGSLLGLVLIMDSRHPLTPLDIQMIHWFAPTGRRIHILLTKADKLSKQLAKNSLDHTISSLVDFADQISVQLFSSLKKQGIKEAEQIIYEIFSVAEHENSES